MIVKFRCQCDRILSVGIQYADKQIACPNCTRLFRIPREAFHTTTPHESAKTQSVPSANPQPRTEAGALSDFTVLPDERELRARRTAVPVARPVPDIQCPSCGQTYSGATRICVPCGIHVHTGRSLITADEGDTDRLYENAEKIIEGLSWISWLGIYPIGSEAYGTRKPYAIFGIVVVTIFVSSLFHAWFVTSSPKMQSAKMLMLWPPDAKPDAQAIIDAHLNSDFGDSTAFEAKYDEIETQNPIEDEDANALEFIEGYEKKRAVAAYEALSAKERPLGEFRYYQLLTNALIHGDLFFHLGGNIFFLVIFGARVNALIGDLLTAIAYPLLAIGASAIYLIAERGGDPQPCLGASGAVMGLAGMYFVFFPVHKMHMAAWFRFVLRIPPKVNLKIWMVRGFWVVLFYIAFDVLATLTGAEDGVAHWAHLGGFIVGIAIALLLLLSRLVHAYGGDLISVLLGRHAWKLIGKPRFAPAAPQRTAAPQTD